MAETRVRVVVNVEVVAVAVIVVETRGAEAVKQAGLIFQAARSAHRRKFGEQVKLRGCIHLEYPQIKAKEIYGNRTHPHHHQA